MIRYHFPSEIAESSQIWIVGFDIAVLPKRRMKDVFKILTCDAADICTRVSQNEVLDPVCHEVRGYR